MPVAELDSEGVITLPQEVLQYLQLVEGDEVEFVFEPDGTVSLRPLAERNREADTGI